MRFLQDPFVPALNGGAGVDITDSQDCTRECLDKGNVFCRDFFAYDKGNCCNPSDNECIVGELDFCSNQFTDNGMKLFTCPFEGNRCGPVPQISLPETEQRQSFQSRGLSTDEVCYYWVQAMQNVEEGTFMYVEFMTMTSVETFISIKRNVDEPDITCTVS